MDVAADHAVVPQAFGLPGHGRFEILHVTERHLHLVLQIGRKRPIRQPHLCQQAVQVTVDAQGQLVQVVAHIGQPFGALHHAVELVAVGHPQRTPVQRAVHGGVHHFDAPKLVADKMAGKFIVVARHERHPAALAGASQQFLNHVIVRLRPVPASLELPAIHNIAHQIQVPARIGLEEIQQGLGLKTWRSNVQVRDKNRLAARRMIGFFGVGWRCSVCGFCRRAKGMRRHAWHDRAPIRQRRGA